MAIIKEMIIHSNAVSLNDIKKLDNLNTKNNGYRDVKVQVVGNMVLNTYIPQSEISYFIDNVSSGYCIIII